MEPSVFGPKSQWIQEALDPRVNGYKKPWTQVSMDTRSLGPKCPNLGDLRPNVLAQVSLVHIHNRVFFDPSVSLDSSVFGPKCLWTQVSLDPSVFGPKCLWTQVPLDLSVL
jgi:hypothetical protein